MRSLRARLAFAIAGAVLAAVAVTALVGALLVDRSLNDGALSGLSRQAALLANTSLRSGPFGTFLATQDERLAVVSRAQAALLLPSAADATSPSSGSLTLHGEKYLFASQPSGRDTVVLLRTEHSVAADHRSFFYALAAAAGVGALLAALLATFLARGIARPVARVAEASRRLAGGATPEPLPEAGSDELRTLARAFNEMAAQLGRAREAERSFLVSISHELRTPLTAVRGYAEGLRDHVLEPARAGEVIEAEARRLERLVVDLLELARLNRLRFDVDRAPVDLAAVAHEAVDRHTPRARELGVDLASACDGDTNAVGDHDRLLQAVSNLVENALRCTPAGGRVDVKARPGAIAVADTGPGIAGEDLPRAFDRFFLYRRYGAERPVGSGLGLAIVRELAQAMDGDVSVESTVGAGTTFTIRLG